MVGDLDPHYQHLTFMAPMSEARAEGLVRFLAASEPGTVVDIGCGWAELLLRVVAAAPQLGGMGIDLDDASVRRAVEAAAGRGLTSRAEFLVGDAPEIAAPEATAVISVGSSQVWTVGESLDRPMDYRLALRSLRGLVKPGGRVVYGEGIWSAPPTPEAVAPLAGRLDEFVTLAELVEVAVECDFMPVGCHEASLDEWDAFESGYTARYATWLGAHPADHPDAPEVRELARRQRAAYLGGYRGILGFAYLELIATPAGQHEGG